MSTGGAIWVYSLHHGTIDWFISDKFSQLTAETQSNCDVDSKRVTLLPHLIFHLNLIKCIKKVGTKVNGGNKKT